MSFKAIYRFLIIENQSNFERKNRIQQINCLGKGSNHPSRDDLNLVIEPICRFRLI